MRNPLSIFRKKNLEELAEERVASKLIDIHRGEAKHPLEFTHPEDLPIEVFDEYVVKDWIGVRIGLHGDEPLYLIDEPRLDRYETATFAAVLDSLYYGFSVDDLPATDAQRQRLLREQVQRAAEKLGLRLKPESVGRVVYYLYREVFGFGVIDALMNDPSIEDIACMGVSQPIFVYHRKHGGLGYVPTNIFFRSEDELSDFIRRQAHKAGRGVSVAQPKGDFMLSDGSRMSAALGREISKFGSNFTIRKYPSEPFSLTRLVALHMFSPLMAAYLWWVVEKRRLIFIAGPTGSGKTTLLNSILNVLPRHLKFLTIEDVFELRLLSPRWMAFTTRQPGLGGGQEVALEDLMMHAVRNRPDILVPGEVRSEGQLLYYVQTATAGHGGACTFHANDPEQMLVRLKSMNIQASALDLLWGSAICQYHEKGEETRRRVTQIVEFVPSEGGVAVENIFSWAPLADTFLPVSVDPLGEKSKRLQAYSKTTMIPLEDILKDIDERARFIEDLVERKTFKAEDVSHEADMFLAKRKMVA